jgi:hypothetical protein
MKRTGSGGGSEVPRVHGAPEGLHKTQGAVHRQLRLTRGRTAHNWLRTTSGLGSPAGASGPACGVGSAGAGSSGGSASMAGWHERSGVSGGLWCAGGVRARAALAGVGAFADGIGLRPVAAAVWGSCGQDSWLQSGPTTSERLSLTDMPIRRGLAAPTDNHPRRVVRRCVRPVTVTLSVNR